MTEWRRDANFGWSLRMDFAIQVMALTAVFLSFCAIASGWCFVIWELVTAPTTN